VALPLNIRQVRKSPATGINIPAYLTGAFLTTKAKLPPNQTANPPQKYICRYRKIKITESYINVQTIQRWKIVKLFRKGNHTPMSLTAAQNKVTCLFSVEFSPKSFTVIKPDWQEPIWSCSRPCRRRLSSSRSAPLSCGLRPVKVKKHFGFAIMFQLKKLECCWLSISFLRFTNKTVILHELSTTQYSEFKICKSWELFHKAENACHWQTL